MHIVMLLSSINLPFKNKMTRVGEGYPYAANAATRCRASPKLLVVEL